MNQDDRAASLHELIAQWPLVYDQARAARLLSELGAAAADEPALVSLRELLAREPVTKLLGGVSSCSPYLARLIASDPLRLQRLLKGAPGLRMREMRRELAVAMDGAATAGEAMRLLRLFKNEVALLTALCDLAGAWPVMQATRELSEAADAAVRAAVRFLFRQAVAKGDWLGLEGNDAPDASSGYIVLAMGKHGAYELNYSSDIDLIVFFDAGLAALREGLEIQPFFVRLTRDLMRLMQERTGDGYVFRTDLRLRPDPGATQVALSSDAALIYYESFGQNWERAALIKARVIAGDFNAGNALLADLSPFIWRKYLDFAAIMDIHAMKRQIHAFKGFGEIGVAGHNIKLGRGGIREIEFFAQTQQLIAGGRQRELRIPATLEALRELAARGWIRDQVCDELRGAYLFLRGVEHRLQMIDDEQTQTLPTEDEMLRRLALFCGYRDIASFSTELRGHLETVQRHYGALFEDDADRPGAQSNMVFSGEDDDPDTLKALSAMGYANPAKVIATVRNWHHGRYAAVRSARGRERLTEVQGQLIEAVAKTRDPDGAIIGFDRFLQQLPTGLQFFALLKANPNMLRLVADIMGSAPRLARIMSRRRRVLDAVLDPGFFGNLPSADVLVELIANELGGAADFQDVLDRARVLGNEQAFLIGVRVLSGTIGAGRAGGAYAQLARCLIDALQGQVEREMANAHGRVAKGGAAVVAMGKLGGEEMTAGSDLDLIVIYDYERAELQSDGTRPLSPNQYYARLTQRLISALAAPTAEGSLYEVDMRLRPSGLKGPVATQLSSFIDYQHNQAWTWEHMALTRARVITGPGALCSAVEGAIRDVLTKPRRRDKIAADLREMRGRIEKEKGTSDIWDLKQVRGGLIDLEFITQYLQLIHGADHPEVLAQNTYQALRKLKDAELIDAAAADMLIPAANLLNNLTQVLRLCLDEPFRPDAAPHGLKDLLCRAAEMPDFQRLEATLRATLKDVGTLFERLIA